MAIPTAMELVAELSPAEQEAVRVFVKTLRQAGGNQKDAAKSRLVAAGEEFIREHPELLSRLAR